MPQDARDNPVKDAAARLQAALKSLERSLTPMTRRLEDLERNAESSRSFDTDRSRLAHELDAAKARELEYQQRETEFKELAVESARELEQAMRLVQMAMGQEGQ